MVTGFPKAAVSADEYPSIRENVQQVMAWIAAARQLAEIDYFRLQGTTF